MNKKFYLNNLVEQAPETPGYTCPIIDSGLRTVELIEKALSKITSMIEDEISNISDLTGNSGEFEKVREANSDLRSCVEYWEERAHEMAGVIAEQDITIIDLEAQRDRLQEELNRLQQSLMIAAQ